MQQMVNFICIQIEVGEPTSYHDVPSKMTATMIDVGAHSSEGTSQFHRHHEDGCLQ